MRLADVLIWVGAAVLIIGILLRFFPGAFSWFGHLPGDVRIQGRNSTVFIPITSMLLASIVLSVVLTLLARLFR